MTLPPEYAPLPNCVKAIHRIYHPSAWGRKAAYNDCPALQEILAVP